MNLYRLIPCLLVFFLWSCAGAVPREAALEAGASPSPMAATEKPSTVGSLWTDTRGHMFQDLKARRLGDLLTVVIFEEARASKEASTSTGRSSDMSAGINRLFGLESRIARINSAIDPTSLVDMQLKNDFSGKGTTSRQENLVASLTVRVVEVLPNGNLGIEGRKTVRVNREEQIITLSGIVRHFDITPDNVINSKSILDSKITYAGKGVLSDKQGQGWLVRVLDRVWPF